MKKLIIGNWKAYKTTQQAKDWLAEFQISNIKYQISNKEVVLCPSFTLLPVIKQEIDRLSLSLILGSQDFSAFPEGAYTGEESPILLQEYIEYAIIGHSERRTHIGETDEMLMKKVDQAKKHNITPIFCVQDAETTIPGGVSVIAYEPTFAIGSGTPDTPENAEHVIRAIKEKYQESSVLYGGSVTPENIRSFTSREVIAGVLVGGASLKAESFSELIRNA